MIGEVSQSSAQCGHLIIGFGIGLAFLSFGLAIRLGYAKRYFLVRGPAPFFGPANYHFLILVGGFFLALGLAGVPGDVQTRQKVFDLLVIPSFVLIFIIGLWQPWWLKPRWIRQLKENHPDIYPFLREAAQEEVDNDRKKAEEWAGKMDTVETQNEWVAEVRKRLGMPDPRTTRGNEQK